MPSKEKQNIPKLTIGLPVFNGGEFIEIAVVSIIEQTFSNWELIIIDDGSTDDTVSRLNKIDDKRITIIHDGKNKGIAVRLNQIIRLARGQYFARMDHDDICHPERFNKQITFLESNKDVDLLATQCIKIDIKENIIGVLPSAINDEQICKRPWLGFYMAHPTWMGKKSWFTKNLYTEPGPYCCEDQELLLRSYKSSIYHTLPEKLLAYRIRKKTPFEKLRKTRFSLMTCQFKFFYNDSNYYYAIMSYISGVARIMRDIEHIIRGYIGKANKKSKNELSSNEIMEWKRVFKKIKIKTKKLNNM